MLNMNLYGTGPVDFIPLRDGMCAIIDADDSVKCAARCWSLKPGTCPRGFYVVSHGLKLHRFLLDANPGQIVDHINGNSLDNRKANLRFVTPGQSARNRHVRKDSASGYKGVCATRGRFRAHIYANGHRHWLGAYDVPEDAALAYDDAARLLHGVHARFNFPSEGEQHAHL